MLEIKNLSLKINNKDILDNINFKLQNNKITVLIGKNGSGKSSIVKSINGIIKYSGKIILDGTNIRNYKPIYKSKRIAVLPQNLPISHITVKELVALGRHPYLGLFGKLSEEDYQVIQESLELLDLKDLEDRYLDTLSGGEVQKAYLAMTLVQNTDILIFDEPTTFLDVNFESYFLEKIKRLKSYKTVLLVLHNITKAIEIADEIIIIDNGKIVYEGSKEKLVSTTIIEDIFNVNKYIINDKIFYTK